MRGDWYQISLIFLGVLITAFFGAFVYREIAPEYKIYQRIYKELENFRSSYTKELPPAFEIGVKQVLIENGKNSLSEVDRCISCHVALQFSHFSPTKIAQDVNGNIIRDKDGIPIQARNDLYVWDKLDQKIESLLKDKKVAEAKKLQDLKTVKIDKHVYDMTNVLRAHPLIGREVRPFQYHPIEEYGCTYCHNGNGRGLTTDKAHGPVLDEDYKAEFMGPKPFFTELDPENDPLFARVFNEKPGHQLLFQTTPLYVGALLQANCVQCHQSSKDELKNIIYDTSLMTRRREEQTKIIQTSLQDDIKALISLIQLKNKIEKIGLNETLATLQAQEKDYRLPKETMSEVKAQLNYFLAEKTKDEIMKYILVDIQKLIGSEQLVVDLLVGIKKSQNTYETISQFINLHQNSLEATGTIFIKSAFAKSDSQLSSHFQEVSHWEKEIENEKVFKTIPSEIDFLIKNFHQGQSLYISQACYACHRINGFARGGIGPELTNAGDSYPWYLKESIVWPQADLRTSTMPNYHLDHKELEDLITFLLAQLGRNRVSSESSYKAKILDWEAGRKMPWEKAINPGMLHDLRYSMTVFTTEGCAACHRLKGFESNVGFKIESEKNEKRDFNALYREREWFSKLFPETIVGSEIVKVVDKNAKEIDDRIVENVRENSILEEIKENHPGLIESFYSNFAYATRAKNHYYDLLLKKAKSSEEKAEINLDLTTWKKRIHRILMAYIQEYGLGRLIGPRPNWSGIYRSDEWLIEHFRKPSRHIPRSIMPVFPFDDSKFYALTYMLNTLAKRNRDEVREIWDHRGFDPATAYKIHCLQCHGEFLHGNGPVAEWLYPIPKNLRNADFLRNFTKENVINSIIHGVKGTPMPPWGEVAEGKLSTYFPPVLLEGEIKQLVDWLFSSLLGGTVIKEAADVPKWQYGPKDVIKEMEREGNKLEAGPTPEFVQLEESSSKEQSFDRSKEAHRYYNPQALYSKNDDIDVKEIFDISRSAESSLEQNLYNIKKKYYTHENIQKGQAFFELNCAVCHGKEADGMGFRAGTMYDAKPRMLTNLHWIDTRDDLRLLRSIKYGVPGTAMTPWGDLTSSLQRLQLVIFIRSLNLSQLKRDALFDAIYVVYDQADQILDTARIEEYKQINNLRDQLKKATEQRFSLNEKIENGLANPEEAMAFLQEELKLNRLVKQHEQADEILLKIKEALKRESQVYQNIGIDLISKSMLATLFLDYLNLINLNNLQYMIKNNTLDVMSDQKKEEAVSQLEVKIIQDMDIEIALKEKEKEFLDVKLTITERNNKHEKIKEALSALSKLKNSLISGFEESKRSRKLQLELYKSYVERLEELKKG
jgi:mono/diheme cytochrome c family protein